MTTLSTLGQSDLLCSEFWTLQSNLQQLRTQVATGEKTERYGDLGARAVCFAREIVICGAPAAR